MNFELNNDEIDILRWAFAKNRHFSDWFVDPSKVHFDTWISYYNMLTHIDQLPIQGIQNKIADIGSPEKLISTLSELKAARSFAVRNFGVELLTDNDQRFKSQKSPDLCISSGKLRFWVEVMNKVKDDTHLLLHQKLDPLAKERDLDISISYDKDISELAVDSKSRNQKKQKFNDLIEEVGPVLKSLDRSRLPYKFARKKSEFLVKSSEPGWGRISCWATSATYISDEDYIQQIKEAIHSKSKKRNSWGKNCLKQPFLIFLDLDSVWLHRAVYPALYGSTNCIKQIKNDEFGFERETYPSLVNKKLTGIQRDLILDLGFDSRRRLYINKPGIFVVDKEVRRNVTGVITMFNDYVECLPNPFCNKSVWVPDLPEILDIPIVNCVADELR